MGKSKSHRSSLKIASVIRKKAKAKHARMKKEAKNKKYPKRTKKMLKAPQNLPFREMIEAQVHESSKFLNDVIRPIQSTRTEDKTKPYDKHIAEVKRQISEQHKEKVREARESFDALKNSIDNADAVIEVLDARDPTACRLCEAENEILEKNKKPMFIFINKIDLVPREVVIGWIQELKNVAPTIAISAINQQASLPVIQEIVLSLAPNAQKIAVIGISSVGKSSICQLNPQLFIEVPSYKFVKPTAEISLLKASDYLSSMYDFAIRIMARKADDNLFLALKIPMQETPDDVITTLCKNWQLKQHLASKKFVDQFLDGSIPFYTMPQNIINTLDGLQQTQASALTGSSQTEEMSGVVFVHLQRGDTISINNKMLGVEDDDDEDDEDDEDEEEETSEGN